MTEDDVFNRTNGAYLCLVRPTMRDGIYRQELAPVLAIAPEVPDDIVASLISTGGWREHVVGYVLAMAKTPTRFVGHVQESLRRPCGIAITPACAFLAVLARSGEFKMEHWFSDAFDRGVFDGEMGWAIDKAMFHAGLPARIAYARRRLGLTQEELSLALEVDDVTVYRWEKGLSTPPADKTDTLRRMLNLSQCPGCGL